MSNMQTEPKLTPGKPGIGGALLKTLPMVLMILFMILGGGGLSTDWRVLAGVIGSVVFFSTLFFLMVYTGKTDRYRALAFAVLAGAFAITFITQLIEVRGSMVLTPEDMMQGDTPFCHMVLPMVILPAIFTKTIIFPGSLLEGFASIGSMIALWFVFSLVFGRGWCSWGCFYGGWDDALSRVGKKPVIKKVNSLWKYLPFAMLLLVVLTSLVSLTPTYCTWFCPFKAITEFEEISSTLILIQTVIFVSIFLGLVIILPVLTHKRTQCGLFCPFGAFQSFTNAVSPVDVRIDTAKCIQCNKCLNICPTFSLDEKSLTSGKTLITCTKCGKCIDNCPVGAITYHVKGTEVKGKNNRARMLYLYAAYFFLATFGGGMVATALYRILLLFTTGSMLT